jgi:hypothetical protein
MQMKEIFGQYYGVDWIAMILSLCFMYSVGSKKRYAFIFGVFSCFAWIFTNSIAEIWPGVLLNFILIGLHTRGYLKWGKVK